MTSHHFPFRILTGHGGKNVVHSSANVPSTKDATAAGTYPYGLRLSPNAKRFTVRVNPDGTMTKMDDRPADERTLDHVPLADVYGEDTPTESMVIPDRPVPAAAPDRTPHVLATLAAICGIVGALLLGACAINEFNGKRVAQTQGATR